MDLGSTDTRGLDITFHAVENGEGSTLSLRRTVHEAPAHGEGGAPRRPVLIVPGYGMNSFIFGFHPRGRSLEGHLAWRGFEVWSVDLRDQGRSSRAPRRPRERYGLEALALTDTAVAVERVRALTQTGEAKVDLVGASLGAAVVSMYVVGAGADRAGSLVSFGGPVRWERVHPLVRVAFRSPRLAGAVPFRGTRALAGVAFPLLVRAPWALSIYMNTRSTETARWREMIQTVEDPVPRINREIAEWIRDRDLTVRGRNVSEGLRRVENPMLAVVALQDGIVPAETARSAFHLSGSSDKALLEVGGADAPMAHADLFLSRQAEREVFEPLAAWLASRA